MKKINCFIPFQDETQVKTTVDNLKAQKLVDKIYLLHVHAGETAYPSAEVFGCKVINVPSINSTAAVKAIAAKSDTNYSLIYTKYTSLSFVLFSLERMVNIIEDTGAAMVYADHFKQVGDSRSNYPVIDYQFGSLRDDFDFGSVLFYRSDAIKEAVSRMDIDYKFAAMYDLRLKVSQKGDLEHINEYLYYDKLRQTLVNPVKKYLTMLIPKTGQYRLRWNKPARNTSR